MHLTGWKYYAALLGGCTGVLGVVFYPIFIYPMMHVDEYKKIQEYNRRGIKQEEIQPGGMRVWSDPFDRK
ncbi:small integral membrane protein 20 [Lycorma delicatula]|uniref:small integral membrane protein 20 n=1 Tax=Lycorma delicatula TaxID=130591 RepID=UPI003F515C80